MPVEVRNLSHIYDAGGPFAFRALEDVSFRIADGEFVAVIGHTGSGKSTLVQHLNGLSKPTSGTVFVGNLNLSDKNTSLKEVRKKVGLVFQYPEYQLFEETVKADIGFGPKNLGLDAEEINDRVREAMELTELDYAELAEKSPFELSGGQKRRVAIAGVLAMEPDILILDEPAAGLDPAGRDNILSLIKKWHESGKTIIMVSHSMDDVADLAQHILVMNHGKLEMEGTPEEIFSKGQRLQEIGLGVPAVTALAMRLNALGFALPSNLYRMEDMEQALLHALKGGKHV